MSTLLAITKRYLAILTFFIYTFKSRSMEWISIRILKKHKKLEVLNAHEIDESGKIAIVAIFPRKSMVTSTLRLINALKSSQYQVILVCNEDSLHISDSLENFLGLAVTVIKRPNIGRDFGAYQCGLDYLLSHPEYSKVNRVLLANDSIYYFPQSEVFLKQILETDAVWGSLFVNYQFHTHAQSFFLTFDRNVVDSREFRNFWEYYYPTSIRHNIINKGEVAFTMALMKSGLVPKSFVNPDLLFISTDELPLTAEEKYGIWNGFHFLRIDDSKSATEAHALQIRRVFMEANVTHHLALLLTRLLGAPLKMDLLRTGLASLDGILKVVSERGIEKSELEDFSQEIVGKGSHVSVKGFVRLWRQYGMG